MNENRKELAEFTSKIGGGLQELEETVYWFELLIRSEIRPAARLEPLMNEANELTAILVTCIKNAKTKAEGGT